MNKEQLHNTVEAEAGVEFKVRGVDPVLWKEFRERVLQESVEANRVISLNEAIICMIGRRVRDA
jgi:hypothetical protein